MGLTEQEQAELRMLEPKNVGDRRLARIRDFLALAFGGERETPPADDRLAEGEAR